jgi:hypothetical protein
MSAEDYALEFFSARGKALTAALIATAVTDESVGKIVRKSLRNWLIGVNDETAVGALRDRVEKRLLRDPRFERKPPSHFWKLSEGPSEAVDVDIDALNRVANGVYVTFFVQKNDSVKRVQLGKSGELEHLLHEVFRAAAGSLHISVIVQILAHRFPHVLDPQRAEPSPNDEDDIHGEASLVPSSVLLPEDELEQCETDLARSQLATEITRSLSEAERALVPVLDDASSAAGILGCGRSSAYERLRVLKAKLLAMSGSEADARSVLGEVLRLCGVDGSARGTSSDEAELVLSDLRGGQST